MDVTGPDMSTYDGINMNPVLGSLFWGTLVSMVFTGTTVIQAYHYFPSKDRPAVQFVALSMLVLDLLSAALVAQGLQYYLLPNFGSTLPLGRLVPTLAAECVATACIIVISQFYFAWQIYALAQKPFMKYIVSGAVVVLSLLAFAGGIGCSVVMFVHAPGILGTRNILFTVMAGAAKVPATLADIIVTCSLCYNLRYVKTGVRATDSVLKTLIGFVIQRGVLVTLVQTALLIVFYASSTHLYWLGLHVNVTRMYANTFFAMLNAREGLKEELQMKSIVTSGFEAYNHNTFRVSKKEADEDSEATEVPPSVWMETIKGRKSADLLEAARIQVDRKVVVSDI